jgi:hypothetical protein
MRTLPDRKATGLKQTTHYPLLLTLKIRGATPPLVMLNGKYILSFFGLLLAAITEVTETRGWQLYV